MNDFSNYTIISDRVQKAIEAKRPLVALESSVIAQGLPFPINLETAVKLEEIALETGVCPATIGIINGKIKIGLDLCDMQKLAQEEGIFKVSKRDIPLVIAREGSGGTTVASTCFIASMMGIKIFATGGIGGVHRDGQNTFDISPDLRELSHNNVIVISAGPKSIIDIKLTLEYLETIGVPILGYKTDYCPHFFTNLSNYPVTMRVDTPEEIALMAKIKWNMNIPGGILVVNPLSNEECLSREEFNKAYHQALQEGEINKISGNKVTPFLLEKINLLTDGKSMKANILLLERNIKLACKISIACK